MCVCVVFAKVVLVSIASGMKAGGPRASMIGDANGCTIVPAAAAPA